MTSNEEVAQAYLNRLERERGNVEMEFGKELARVVVTIYAIAIDQGLNLDKFIQDKYADIISHPPESQFPEDEGPEGKWASESMHRGRRPHQESFQEWIDEGIVPMPDTPDLSGNISAPPHVYEMARSFLEAAFQDVAVPEDAVGQLVDGFLPSLRIICERKYKPNGATWRRAGRKGIVREILKNSDRIHDRDWLSNILEIDSAQDLINYCAYYLRSIMEGLDSWGYWGEPARGGDEDR